MSNARYNLFPSKPAFYAYNLNFPYQTAGQAVGGTVSVNIGSGYNGTTGRFTVPVAGTYVIQGMTMYYSDGSSTYQTVAIYKNGSSIGAECWQGNTGTSGNNHAQANTTVIADLEENDYIQVHTYYGSRDIQNFFCAHLVS